jgi:hypothetical protein
MVENTTYCQDPIENLNVTMTVQSTVQRPEWEPDMVIARGEELTVVMKTTRGYPFVYNVSWGDTTYTSDTTDNWGGGCTFYLI